MKKVFGIILGLLLIFRFTGTINASCVPGASACSGTYGTSYSVSGSSMCCTDSSSCTALNATVNPPANTNTNSAPAAAAAGSGTSIFCGSDGIQTAIGCIHALGSQNAFASDILTWAIGVGSGIAFLLILYGGFMVMTSAGNPDRLKAGQELLTSAISGLLLLIFCVFILNFIGIKILGIFS